MALDLPRRPGFTSGTEEFVWKGHPSLRSTVYSWTLSSLAAWLISLVWVQLFTSLYANGMLPAAPLVTQMIYGADGQMALWFRVIPWVVCLVPVFWYSLNLAATTYELSTQRLTVRTGILVRTMDQVELFRVRDFMVDTPLHYMILGIAHVRVISRDESLPILTMIAQPRPYDLVDVIRFHTQRRKDEVGMREIETNTA